MSIPPALDISAVVRYLGNSCYPMGGMVCPYTSQTENIMGVYIIPEAQPCRAIQGKSWGFSR